MELNNKYSRLEEKLNNKKYDLIQLNENLNKLNELCRKIKNKTILETRVEEVMRLEDILVEKENDRAKIESCILFLEKEVEALERELHSLKVAAPFFNSKLAVILILIGVLLIISKIFTSMGTSLFNSNNLVSNIIMGSLFLLSGVITLFFSTRK